MSRRDPGPIPNRWLKCPRKATELIADKFLAFKTPLGPQFNEKVPDVSRFTPAMLFMNIKSMKMKIGLWIDLTNTTRFYDKSEVEKMDCKYVKLQCRGHGETPSMDQTREFIKIVTSFINEHPTEIIGVHCTHGFNRTGFLLTSYMVEELDWSLEAALNEFAKKREPGIYKDDYLRELFSRYDDQDFTPEAPPRPDWCIEEEDKYDDDDTAGYSQNQSYDNAPQHSNSNHSHKKKGKKETTHKKESFLPEVSGVEPFNEQPRLSDVQKKVQAFCKWESTGFPGSQPVSMDRDNIRLLRDKPYRVSWKADGVRYLMLIDDENEVYMLDRDNCAFKVHGLKFIHNKEHRHLKNTLLDGEMVIDRTENGEGRPRFLVYDIIRFENMNVGKESFYPVRLQCIEKEIINPRNRAIVNGVIKKEQEPFSVQLKQFWAASRARALLQDKFARTLTHEPDGLIFQPSKDPYKAGRCDHVLKWKPPCLNSVDFRLKIVREDRAGMLPTRVGHLYVGQKKDPFGTILISSKLKNMDNKIIECKFENNKWAFMRERTDKSYPNSYTTAVAVCNSIMHPVDKDYLLSYIENHQDQFHEEPKPMNPPKRPRH
ncbi:mRNA-capping enzyme [Epargyreus clarus]|uniref:mRNA-capping enzyme n=1 Tax=Epargyreus clarus TaxID=520877 RepID=UPI003C308032